MKNFEKKFPIILTAVLNITDIAQNDEKTSSYNHHKQGHLIKTSKKQGI